MQNDSAALVGGPRSLAAMAVPADLLQAAVPRAGAAAPAPAQQGEKSGLLAGGGSDDDDYEL